MFMNKDQWMYDSIMSEEVDKDDQNEQECGVNEQHVDCSDAFNTSQIIMFIIVFGTRDDVLQWARSVAHENGFVAVIMRSDTNTDSREKISFVLSGCERSDFVRRDTESRKCECPFKLRGKLVVEGQGWMSMMKPRNILLMLKEHNANNYTTIKQIYNDEDVVRDIFWCHLDAVKLCNACNLVFLIDSTYKINRYRLPLLDFVGVILTGMTFSAGFAYLEGEHVNNAICVLERFRGIFLRRDVLPGVIVTDRDLALMNAVKTIFYECTNLLCMFHINKNVKAKCKSPIGQKMLGSMSWMPKEVWLIVLRNISSMNSLRSLKLLVHLGQCLLTMLTKYG
ncbi:Protein FAR1-RELATED SEQUENCE 6 [Glycine soja]